MINLNQIKVEDILKKGDILLIIVIIFVGLIIAVKVNAGNKNNAEVIFKEIKLKKEMNTFLSDINVAARDYEIYKKEIFFGEDSTRLLNLINEWARSFGVEIISLRPRNLGETDLFLNIPIELTAKSNYFSLGQFLSCIESYKGFIDIKNLTITPERTFQTRKSLESESLKVTLLLNAVILKELGISGMLSRRR